MHDDPKTMSLDSVLKSKWGTFGRDMRLAMESLKDEGGEFISRDADYEIAWYVEDGLRVIFYPHRTSASNYHIRIRIHGKRTDRARYIMTKLYYCQPHYITFQWKGLSYNELHEWADEFGIDTGLLPTKEKVSE